MGLRKLFKRSALPLVQLPAGSFTVDRTGRMLVSTVSSSFPMAMLQEISRCVLEAFHDAQTAQLPLSEMVIHYGSMIITARELRGGAIVFLSPKNPISPVSKPTS